MDQARAEDDLLDFTDIRVLSSSTKDINNTFVWRDSRNLLDYNRHQSIIDNNIIDNTLSHIH